MSHQRRKGESFEFVSFLITDHRTQSKEENLDPKSWLILVSHSLWWNANQIGNGFHRKKILNVPKKICVAKVSKTGVGVCPRFEWCASVNPKPNSWIHSWPSSIPSLVASLTNHVTRYLSHVKSPSFSHLIPRAQNKNHIRRASFLKQGGSSQLFFEFQSRPLWKPPSSLQIILLASPRHGRSRLIICIVLATSLRKFLSLFLSIFLFLSLFFSFFFRPFSAFWPANRYLHGQFHITNATIFAAYCVQVRVKSLLKIMLRKQKYAI